MKVWRLVAAGYAALALLAAGLATYARDGHPLTHPRPWVVLSEPTSLALSVALGAAFAGAVVAVTRLSVARYGWARRLHGELRPSAWAMPRTALASVVVLSAVGEELFFRSVLAPAIGVVGSAVVFGLAHQMRGPSRWVWAASAGAVGLGLGLIFALSGSLAGSLIAHVAINGCNLVFLRGNDPRGRPSSLGGILRRPGPRVGART